jgi:hypothetical protein
LFITKTQKYILMSRKHKVELIKTPSFEAIDNMADLIYKDLQGAIQLEVIRTNVSKVLLTDGASIFVELYNTAITSKNYVAFTKNLKIY